MSNSGDFRLFPATTDSNPKPPTTANATIDIDPHPPLHSPLGGADPRVPLLNLSTVRARMDSLQAFLAVSLNNHTLINEHQMEMVSAEISSAIHQIIVNGAALLSCSQTPEITSQIASKLSESDLKTSVPICIHENESIDFVKEDTENVNQLEDETNEDDYEIIELDSVEILAEHIHFCDICGKGFKRDANLRMHMRAHGNQYKTPEALAKPETTCVESARRRRNTRFSCPFVGCNRNKSHKKFRPMKSVICVKNHFKRSHCPKMYSCNRCNKKSFAVVADLKSHLKHCGESKWKCSCGTTFSRKDKLFGHMTLFEGHMPAVMEEENEKGKGTAASVEDEEEMEMEMGPNCMDNGFFEGLLEGFGSIDNYCFQDVLGSPSGGNGVNGYYDL